MSALRLVLAALQLLDAAPDGDQMNAASAAAATYELPVEVLLAVAWHETRFDPTLRNARVCGPMQTKWTTRDDCALWSSPDAGYAEGARVLAYWRTRSGGDLTRALDAYACGNVGLYAGCRGFGRGILAVATRLSQAADRIATRPAS